MLSVAFLLSLAVTEITLSLIYTYIRTEDMISFSLVDLYGSQLGLYLTLLLICMLAILYPISVTAVECPPFGRAETEAARVPQFNDCSTIGDLHPFHRRCIRHNAFVQ